MSDVVDLAVRAATDAGALLLERFGRASAGVASKTSRTDMVSDADRDAEHLIVERILSARPDDAILGEEHGERAGSSGLRWIIDPLDGTTNFLYGIPQWCVSIACEDATGTLAGVVHDPSRGETFVAARGEGTRRNSEPVRVSDLDDLARALVATGFAYLPDERAVQGPVAARILPLVRDLRRPGSAALDLAWVACGRFDGYYESSMGVWDRAAGELLVREAGGVVTPLPPVGASGRGGVVAAGPALHPALAALVGDGLR